MMFSLSKSFQKCFLPLIVLVLITFSVFGGFLGQAQAAGFDLSNSTVVADIAEQSSPAVVWIITTYENRNPFQRFSNQPKQDSQGLGSGFFFNEDGSILTNAHVVAGAKAIEVTLKDQKKSIPAKLVGIDQELDVAVLKVDLPNKIPFLQLGNSDQSRIGEWVIAIGNPYGLDHTVTLGIISAKGRPIVAGDPSGNIQPYDNMIQTDAAINPGNSGGPLLNLHGQVIGINSLINSSGQGLGFAIPINSVRNILDELITKGKVSHPWLGVQMWDLKWFSAFDRARLGLMKYNEGVLIDPVPNSPAANANLEAGDLITEFNHQPVTNSTDLSNYVKRQKIGNEITLTVVRGGEVITVNVILQEKP